MRNSSFNDLLDSDRMVLSILALKGQANKHELKELVNANEDQHITYRTCDKAVRRLKEAGAIEPIPLNYKVIGKDYQLTARGALWAFEYLPPEEQRQRLRGFAARYAEKMPLVFGKWPIFHSAGNAVESFMVGRVMVAVSYAEYDIAHHRKGITAENYTDFINQWVYSLDHRFIGDLDRERDTVYTWMHTIKADPELWAYASKLWKDTREETKLLLDTLDDVLAERPLAQREESEKEGAAGTNRAALEFVKGAPSRGR